MDCADSESLLLGMLEETRQTTHNKRLSEMAVGVEASSILRLSTTVIVHVTAHPVRHFAKPPGVI